MEKLEGVIEEASLKKGAKGNYWEFKISGKTYRLFEKELFTIAEGLKLEQPVTVEYFDNEWGSNPQAGGQPYVSHVITKIEPREGFQKASEVAPTQHEVPIEDLMDFCLETALSLVKKHGDKGIAFTGDNVTSICNSLFIEANKRKR